MDTGSHREDYQSQFGDAVSDRVLVDVFKPKIGSEKDIVVFTFLVDQRHAAQKLSRFISQGPFDVVDVEASPAPDEEGQYLVFLEMQRNRNMYATLDDILEHIGFMAGVASWRFRPYGHKTFIGWNQENFLKTVPQSPGEYESAGEKSNSDRPVEVLENKPRDLIESNNLSLQQLIENQINRHSKAYIKSLQEQIQAVIQDNQQLVERVEDLKKEQQYLHQQIEFYQKRENMSLEREEQIYERIRDMESKIELLGAPEEQKPESMVSEIMVDPPTYGDEIVADAVDTDLLESENIQLPASGIDLIEGDRIEQASEELDPVDTTMFELETSLGMSPAESFLSEDELIDEGEQFDTADQVPVIKDTEAVNGPLGESDDDSYRFDRAVLTEAEGVHGNDADASGSIPEPDFAALTSSDAFSEPSNHLPAAEFETEIDSAVAADEGEFSEDEPVADLPPTAEIGSARNAASILDPKTTLDDTGDTAAETEPGSDESVTEYAETVSGAIPESVIAPEEQEEKAYTATVESTAPADKKDEQALKESAKQQGLLHEQIPIGEEGPVATASSAGYHADAGLESDGEVDKPVIEEDHNAEESLAVTDPKSDESDDFESDAILDLDTPLSDEQALIDDALTSMDTAQDGQDEFDDDAIVELDEPLDEEDDFLSNKVVESDDSAGEKKQDPVGPIAESEHLPYEQDGSDDGELMSSGAVLQKEEEYGTDAIMELDTPLETEEGPIEEATAELAGPDVKEHGSFSEEITEPASVGDKDRDDAPESDIETPAVGTLSETTDLGDESDTIPQIKKEPDISEAADDSAAPTDQEEIPILEAPVGPPLSALHPAASPEAAEDLSAKTENGSVDGTEDIAEGVEIKPKITEDEITGDQEVARPMRTFSHDLSNLEDTIHELESIVVTETDSQKAAEVAERGESDTSDVKEQARQYLILGNDAYQHSRFLKAIEYFSKAVELTPDAPVGHLNLAVLAYRLSDYEGAANHARRAIKMGSQSASKILEKAESKIKADEKTEGSDQLIQSQPQHSKPPETDATDDSVSEVIDLTPENEVPSRKAKQDVETTKPTAVDGPKPETDSPAAVLLDTAAELLDTAEPQEAVQAEGTAERDIANEYFAMGLAASDKNKYPEAFEYFKKAVELTPDIPAGHLNLAVIAYKLKDYRQAADFAEKALAGGSRSARKILDKAAAKLKTTSEALTQTAKSKGLTDEPAVKSPRADTGDSKLPDPPDLDPRSDVYDLSAGSAGKTTARQAKEASPPKRDDDSNEPVDKAGTEKEEKQDPSATATGRIEDEKNAANEYFALGLAASENKNYPQAVEHFQKVVELSPDTPAGYLNLAVLDYRRKDYPAAQKNARKALALGSQSARKILDKATQKLESKHRVNGTKREKKIDDTPLVKDAARTPEAESFKTAPAPQDGLTVEDEEIVFDAVRRRQATEPMEETDESTTAAVIPDDARQRVPKAALQKEATTSETELANEYFRLGVEASEQKAFEKAIRYFTKVTEILPTARRSYIKLAVLYYQIKDFKTAKELAQKAIDLGSTSAEKILKKSEAKLKQRAAAKTESAPTSPKSRTDRPGAREPEAPLRGAQGEAGKTDATTVPTRQEPPVESTVESTSQTKPAGDASPTERAEKPVEPSVTKNYSVNEYFAMGLAASERKEYHQAIEYFTKVTELLPDASPSFLNLANLYLNLEDYATAREHAQRALDLGSKSAQRILDDVDALTK